MLLSPSEYAVSFTTFTFPVKKSNSVCTYVNPFILDITCAASFPSPFKITLKGSFLTLLADFAIPIAPSAAAKLWR